MEFTTQAELLEYLGKNPNDRNLVQRMIRRGEVVKRDGMYHIVNKKAIIEENIELREEIERLKKSEPKQEVVVPVVTVSRNSEEIKLLRNHLSYVWQRNEHRRACIEKMVQAFFEKNRQKYDYESAMEAFYKVIWFIDDIDENDEREWAISEWLLPF